MKFIVMPDSFKGTVSATRISEIIKGEINLVFPGSEVLCLPIADGGEGTVDAFMQSGGQKRYLRAAGPFFTPVDSFYGKNGDTAVIEMAACASLPLAGENKNPMLTTTYGVGELIKAALDEGASNIILGLGGSCTNDGGCGMAAALGVRFLDGSGNAFIPVGGTLKDIAGIDLSHMDKRIYGRLTVMCDIQNPLYGPNGAAFVFAPQKGASDAEVRLLDDGLKHLAQCISACMGTDISALPGGGAAGGMGAGAAAFLGGRLCSGIDVMLDYTGFDSLLCDTDCVLTGEGSCDSQSLMGKAISGIARLTSKHSVPLIVIAGGIKGDPAPFYASGITALVSATRRPMTFAELAPHAEEFLRQSTQDALRLIRLGMSLKG